MGDGTFLTQSRSGFGLHRASAGRSRVRDIATRVHITERAAHRIVCDLEAHGYLTRHRLGNRNFYEVHPDRPLRDPTQPNLTIGDLLRVLLQLNRLDPADSDTPSGRMRGDGFRRLNG